MKIKLNLKYYSQFRVGSPGAILLFEKSIEQHLTSRQTFDLVERRIIYACSHNWKVEHFGVSTGEQIDLLVNVMQDMSKDVFKIRYNQLIEDDWAFENEVAARSMGYVIP